MFHHLMKMVQKKKTKKKNCHCSKTCFNCSQIAQTNFITHFKSSTNLRSSFRIRKIINTRSAGDSEDAATARKSLKLVNTWVSLSTCITFWWEERLVSAQDLITFVAEAPICGKGGQGTTCVKKNNSLVRPGKEAGASRSADWLMQLWLCHD